MKNIGVLLSGLILFCSSLSLADKWHPMHAFRFGCTQTAGAIATGGPSITSPFHLTSIQKHLVESLLVRLSQVKDARHAHEKLKEWSKTVDDVLSLTPSFFLNPSRPKDDIPTLTSFLQHQLHILIIQRAFQEIDKWGYSDVGLEAAANNRPLHEYAKKVASFRRLEQLPENIIVMLEWNVRVLEQYGQGPRETHWQQIDVLDAWLL